MKSKSAMLLLALIALLCIAGATAYFSREAPGGPVRAEEEQSKEQAPKKESGPKKEAPKRNPKWAVKIEGKPGLPNLHKITEDLYRGAQPTAEGMKQLKEMGIKTVVNLRWMHSDKDEIGDLGLKSVEISMKAWHGKEEDVVKFLKILADKENYPIFFHCQHGADRTGTMCAVYRMAVCGWTKEEAIEEMTEGGFNFHEVWKNLPEFLKNLDVEKVKKAAGLASAEKE